MKQPSKKGKPKPDTLSRLVLALTIDRNEKTRLVAHGADPRCVKTATNLMGLASPAKVSPFVVFSVCDSTFGNLETQCSGFFGIAQTRQDPYRGPPEPGYEVEIGHFKKLGPRWLVPPSRLYQYLNCGHKSRTGEGVFFKLMPPLLVFLAVTCGLRKDRGPVR